jgi:flagellar hook-associated protein 3 FlgL
MEIGDKIHLSIGSRSFSYVITGDEGLNNDQSPQAAVLQAFTNAVNASGLFSQSATIALDPLNPEQVQVSALRENIGLVQFESEDRTAINDQSIQVNLVQQPTPPIPERVEFFESLQEFSHFLRNGTQDQIQSKLDHFDQMLDIVTLSLADIGSEMGSLEDEITINEDLKLQLKTTLSGEEDLDLASAITKMQAQMMSLEAAQASFAKISQLSLFDYIR